MKEITVQELKELMDSSADFQLIDVRKQKEYDFVNLNGELIPLDNLADEVKRISRDKQVVVHCRSGQRSTQAIDYLEQNHGYDNLYNLVGGLLAWSDKIDPMMPKY